MMLTKTYTTGEMAERLMALVSKTGDVITSEGSNPSLSAKAW